MCKITSFKKCSQIAKEYGILTIKTKVNMVTGHENIKEEIRVINYSNRNANLTLIVLLNYNIQFYYSFFFL